MRPAAAGQPEPSRRVLVIGRSGRLALALARQSWPKALEPLFAGREQLDLSDPNRVAARLQPFDVGCVINTAAYTDVDGAESHGEAAYRLNRDGPAALARACAARDIDLIHVSTDYVFGEGQGARSEADPTGPLNLYGHSKLAGEKAVLEAHPSAKIVRTAWLFDGYSPNFLTTMLGLSDRPELQIISDQYGSPTLTDHLACGLIELALAYRSIPQRLLHYANEGGASRFEMAQALFAKLGDAAPRPVLQPISASQWPAAAARPDDSRLDVTGWTKAGLRPPPDWQAAIAEGVEQWRSTKDRRVP